MPAERIFPLDRAETTKNSCESRGHNCFMHEDAQLCFMITEKNHAIPKIP